MANMTKGTDGRYYYEQTGITDNFNMHIEKEFPCAVQVLVKTAGTKYAPAHVFNAPALVIDADFTGEVFGDGKSVKVVCLDEAPTDASAPTIEITTE